MTIPGVPVTGSAGAIGVVSMSVSPTDSGGSAAPEGASPPVPEPAVEAEAPVAPRDRAVPRTRWSAAWAGICAAALALVALIVFMLQNTGSVEVTFLWMHGSLPLAMALLIAAVGAAILTMVFGAGRITQLRRLARRRRE
jgi:lipopolysaccharide assembly protein A